MTNTIELKKLKDIITSSKDFNDKIISNLGENFNGSPVFLDFKSYPFTQIFVYKTLINIYGDFTSAIEETKLIERISENLSSDLPELWLNAQKMNPDFLEKIKSANVFSNTITRYNKAKVGKKDYEENEIININTPNSDTAFADTDSEETNTRTVSRSSNNLQSIEDIADITNSFKQLNFNNVAGLVRTMFKKNKYAVLFLDKRDESREVIVIAGPQGPKGDAGAKGEDGDKVVTAEIKALQDKDVVIEADITSIKSKNSNQDTLLGTHSNDIIRINAKNGAQDTKIATNETNIASNTRIVNDVSSKFNVIDIDTTGLVNTSYNTFLNSLDENRNQKVVFDSGSVKYYFAKKDTDNSGNPILFFNALIDKVVYIKTLTIIKIIDNIEVVNIADANIDLSKTGSGGSGATITNHNLITTALVGGSLNTLKAKINKNSVYTFNNFTEYYSLSHILNGSGNDYFYFTAITKDKVLYVSRLQISYNNDNITKATFTKSAININTIYHTANGNRVHIEDLEWHILNNFGLVHKTNDNLIHFSNIAYTSDEFENTTKSDEAVFIEILEALENKKWIGLGLLTINTTKTAEDTVILEKIKSLFPGNKVYTNTTILMNAKLDGSHKIQVLLNTTNSYQEVIWDWNNLKALTNKTTNTLNKAQYDKILADAIKTSESYIDADKITLQYTNNNGIDRTVTLKTIINDTIANSTATLGNSTDIITNSNNITTNTTNIATNTTNITSNTSKTSINAGNISRNLGYIQSNLSIINHSQIVIANPDSLNKTNAKEGNFLKQIVNSKTVQTFIFKAYILNEASKKYTIIETVNLDKVFSDHVWEAINYKIEWKTDGSDLDVTKKAITTSRAQIPTNEEFSKIDDTAKESLRQLKEIVKVHKGEQIATTQKEALKYTPNNLKDFDDSLSIPVGLKKWINDNFYIDDRVINSQNVKECRVHLHWSSWKDDPFVRDSNTILIQLYAWLRTKMNTFDNIVTDSTFNSVDLYINTTQTNALSTFHYKIAIVINKGKSDEKNAYLELQNGVSRIEDYDDTIAASTTLIKFIDRLKDEYINLNKVKVNDGITIRDFIDSRFINLETLSLTWDKVYNTSNCEYNGNEYVKQLIPCLNKEEGSIRNCSVNVSTQTFTLSPGFYKISADINFYSTIYTGMGIDFTGNYALSSDFVKTTSSFVNEGNNNMLRLGGIIKVNSTTTFTVKFESSKTGTRNAAFCHNKTAIYNDYDYSKISVTKIGYIT